MKCTFSGKEISPGTGRMYVKKDGTILWFSSSKAKKNMLELGRKANRVKWTEDARAAKQANLATLRNIEEAKHEEDAGSKKASGVSASTAKKKKAAPKKKK